MARDFRPSRLALILDQSGACLPATTARHREPLRHGVIYFSWVCDIHRSIDATAVMDLDRLLRTITAACTVPPPAQGLGRASHALGHHHDALNHHHAALAMATELGQPTDQARAHDGLAHTLHALGDTIGARDHWCTALDILNDLNVNHTDEHLTITNIQAHLDACRHRQAHPAAG